MWNGVEGGRVGKYAAVVLLEACVRGKNDALASHERKLPERRKRTARDT